MQKYGTDPELDKLVDSRAWKIREKAANQGYGLDKLINDEDYDVRVAVAEQGYGLNVLINDEDYEVRKACTRSNAWKEFCVNNWETLMHNEYNNIRVGVAEQGYGLDVLINDETWYVRAAVAKQGYGLDILVNDEDKDVRLAVKCYLDEHNYKSLEDWAKHNPNKVHGENNIQLTDDLKDFIYKINESSKLETQSNCDNIDEFFTIKESDILVICALDTKLPLIKIEKSISDQRINFKFIVNIINEDGESFSIKTFIKSKEQLSQKIEQTIEALNQYPEFSKYVTDLENCL